MDVKNKGIYGSIVDLATIRDITIRTASIQVISVTFFSSHICRAITTDYAIAAIKTSNLLDFMQHKALVKCDQHNRMIT